MWTDSGFKICAFCLPSSVCVLILHRSPFPLLLLGSEVGLHVKPAIEQQRSNKLTLMYLGVPIDGPALLLGDNKTIVDNTTTPHGKLHKRHLMLSYHYIRESIASGSYKYAFVNGKDNLSDILSKHWSYNDVWPLL